MLLNYDAFKTIVQENFLSYMPFYFRGMELLISPVAKKNMTLDGLRLKGNGVTGTPVIYINDMYALYEENGDLEETIKISANVLVNAFKNIPNINVDSLFQNASKKIVFQLVNTELNKSLLEQVPHRSFLDLSIIYSLVITVDSEGMQSTKVTNDLAYTLGLTENQLFKYATENTKRLFPATVRKMDEVMREMCLMAGMPLEFAEGATQHPFWIISTTTRINGAASLLYEDELHKLAESLESNLYVLPFMESEVFVISADLSDPKDLKDLTSEILEDSIPLDEKLSDQIYFYDRALRNLTLVTTTTSEIIRRAQSGRSNERIEKQSTIFDPDEVVKQLGKAAFARYGNDGMGGEMVVNLDDAIKIVKGDGVDDTCIRAENKESVSQTYLEALIAKYEGYTKLNEEKPLETNSYENGANNALLAVIADLKEMISRS